MIDRIASWLKNNYFYIFVFLFFFYINCLTPPIFDDWEISFWLQNYNNNLLKLLIHGPAYFWLYMNGRFFTNPIMILATHFSFLWKIVSALIFMFIVYFFNNFIENKNKNITLPLSFLLIISVSNGIRMETYSYISAHVAFIFAFALALCFLILISKLKVFNYPQKLFFLLPFLSFAVASWMENLGLGFSVFLLLLNIIFIYKNKSLNHSLFASLLSSLMGNLFAFTSPGMRTTRDIHSPLLETFRMSFPKNINLIVFQNKSIFLILSTVTLYFFIKRKGKVKNKYLYFSYLTYLFFISVVLFLAVATEFFPNFLNNLNSMFFRYLFFDRLLTASFWLMFLVSFLIPIIYLVKNQFLALFLYVYALFSILPVFLINTIGNRIIAVPTISFAMLAIIFLSEINFKLEKAKKKLSYIILFALLLQLFNWANIHNQIYKTQLVRQLIINQVVFYQAIDQWDYRNTVILPKFNEQHVWHSGSVSVGDFHYQPFLKYHNLNQNTKVMFK